MRCSSCSRLGYMAAPSVHADLCLYACGDDRLICRGCVVRMIDEATAVCAHGRARADYCLACDVLRAVIEP